MHMRLLSHIYHGSGLEVQFHQEFTHGMGNLGEEDGKLHDFGSPNQVGPENMYDLLLAARDGNFLWGQHTLT